MKPRQTRNAEELVAAAAAWRLASLLLERPRPDWKRELAKLSSEIAEQELLRAVDEAGEGTEEIYLRLFASGGLVSPREVSYCGYEDPGHVMAQLSAFYRAFSFQPCREEPIDHISVQAGFMGYLLLKEAYALMRDDAESAAITAEAEERFVKEHLGRCAQGMIERSTELPTYLRNVLGWMAEQTCADRQQGGSPESKTSRAARPMTHRCDYQR